MVEFPRRGFLSVLTTATVGLFLAPGRLLAAPTELVLRLGGACSFCGKQANETDHLAGLPGRPVRICNECVALCLDILPLKRSRPPRKTVGELRKAVEDALALDPQSAVRELARLQMTPRDAERWLRSKFAKTPACSFCDADEETAHKLIAGPKVYICDGCVAGASTLIGRLG